MIGETFSGLQSDLLSMYCQRLLLAATGLSRCVWLPVSLFLSNGPQALLEGRLTKVDKIAKPPEMYQLWLETSELEEIRRLKE